MKHNPDCIYCGSRKVEEDLEYDTHKNGDINPLSKLNLSKIEKRYSIISNGREETFRLLADFQINYRCHRCKGIFTLLKVFRYRLLQGPSKRYVTHKFYYNNIDGSHRRYTRIRFLKNIFIKTKQPDNAIMFITEL
jgi:hypothetical protein